MKTFARTILLLFVVFAVLLTAFSATIEAKTSQTDEKKLAIEKVSKIIEEIAERSYPEIKLEKIRVKTFESESNFFKARFSYTRYLTFQKMRHIIYVNPSVFKLNAPEDGVRGILAHELAHVLYYTGKNRLELIGLVNLASDDFTAKFERKADLEAISRGYGEGLIKYREWLYQNIPAKDLDTKKRNYFSPEEISLIMSAIKQKPDLIKELRKDIPQNLEEVREKVSPQTVTANCIPPLPEPHANNAVAQIEIDGKFYIFSFAGLKSGKTWKDTSKSAFMFVEGEKDWRKLPDLPVELGRLAASAQGVETKVYYFGGYTVAEDGSEKSTPEVFSFDPKSLKYKRLADMPTPVDDMVTFTYKDRYIYLVSGWHDDRNVNLVQIYDTKKNKWQKGTEYPGTPVFGHAGGIVGNKFVIADGVAVVGKTEKGSRIFDTVNEGWLGTIDEKDHTKIKYQRLPQLPGKGHYRMAGAGDAERNQIIFIGGTPTAYNYNGTGYDGTPADAKKHVFAWDLTQNKWFALEDKPVASMDHRGMVKINNKWLTIGGLDSSREVSGSILGETLLQQCESK